MEIPCSMFSGIPFTASFENAFTHVYDNYEITSKTRNAAVKVSSKLPRAAQLQTMREKKRGN